MTTTPVPLASLRRFLEQQEGLLRWAFRNRDDASVRVHFPELVQRVRNLRRELRWRNA